MVPINTYSIVLCKIYAKQKWLLKVLLISNVTFTTPLGHNLYHSLVLLVTASLPYILSDIWLYSGKKIHEYIATVSNNAVTGSVLNNFTSNVANLPVDCCAVDTMFFLTCRLLSGKLVYH